MIKFIQNTATMIFLLLLINSHSTSAQNELKWLERLNSSKVLKQVNKIKLLESSRDFATSVFSDAREIDKTGSFYDVYRTQNGDVWVRYTTKECTVDNSRKIPINTIDEISIYLNDEFPLNKLVLPPNEFEREDESDTPLYSLKNVQNGVMLEINELFDRGPMVQSIEFFPPSKMNYSCP